MNANGKNGNHERDIIDILNDVLKNDYTLLSNMGDAQQEALAFLSIAMLNLCRAEEKCAEGNRKEAVGFIVGSIAAMSKALSACVWTGGKKEKDHEQDD